MARILADPSLRICCQSQTPAGPSRSVRRKWRMLPPDFPEERTHHDRVRLSLTDAAFPLARFALRRLTVMGDVHLKATQ